MRHSHRCIPQIRGVVSIDVFAASVDLWPLALSNHFIAQNFQIVLFVPRMILSKLKVTAKYWDQQPVWQPYQASRHLPRLSSLRALRLCSGCRQILIPIRFLLKSDCRSDCPLCVQIDFVSVQTCPHYWPMRQVAVATMSEPRCRPVHLACDAI